MKIHMEYQWFESLPFILMLSFFWFLLFPIPIVIYLTLRRFEKLQLSRLIIVKILGIDYYRNEIAKLSGSQDNKEYELEFEITEESFQRLSHVHETLRIKHDRLSFQKMLDEAELNTNEKSSKENLRIEKKAREKDVLKKSKMNKKVQGSPKKKEEKKKEKDVLRRPVVKKDRIVITEEELFSDGLFDDDDLDIFF